MDCYLAIENAHFVSLMWKCITIVSQLLTEKGYVNNRMGIL